MIYIFFENILKTMNEAISSGVLRDDISTARKIGTQPVYINPKELQSSHNIKIIDSLKSTPKEPTNPFEQFIKTNSQIDEVKRIVVLHQLNKYQLALEFMLFLGFLVGMYVGTTGVMVIEIVVAVVCLGKIVGYHIWLGMGNRRKERLGIEGNLYEEKVLGYQLLQLWGIVATGLLYGFGVDSFVGRLLGVLRSGRLLFPFFLNYDIHHHSHKFIHSSMILPLLKTLFCCIFFLATMTIAYAGLLTQLQTYHCVQNLKELEGVGERCGVVGGCDVGNCRGLLEYVSVEGYHREVERRSEELALELRQKNVLEWIVEVWIVGMGMQTVSRYTNYEGMFVNQIICLLIIVIHLGLWLLIALSTGTLLRSRVRNKLNLGRRQRTVTFKAPNEQQQTDQDCPYTCIQPADINKQYKQISKCNKLFATLYNLVVLAHYLLVFVFDAELEESQRQVVGVLLGIFFILWSVCIAVAVYMHIGEEPSPKQQLQQWILTYELPTYLITFADYAVKAISKELVFEAVSMLTPLSHLLICLRLWYILYNNAFFSYFSHYSEVVLCGIWWSRRILAKLLFAVVVLGMIRYNFGGQEGIVMFCRALVRSMGEISQVEFQQGDGLLFVMLGRVAGVIWGLLVGGWLLNTYFYHTKLQPINHIAEEVEASCQSDEPSACSAKMQSIVSSQYYQLFKVLLVLISFIYGIALGSSMQHTRAEGLGIGLIIIDGLFFLVICLEIWAYGSDTYFQKYKILKILYILSFLYIVFGYCLMFFIYKPLDLWIRAIRIVQLVGMVRTLRRAVSRLVKLLFGEYKLWVYLAVSIVLVLAVVPVVGLLQGGSIGGRFQTSIVLVYFHNFQFIEHAGTLPSTFAAFSLYLLYMIVIVPYRYILCGIMIRSMIASTPPVCPKSLISKFYLEPSSSTYLYEEVTCSCTYSVLKYVKVWLLLCSTVLMCLLMGSTVVSIEGRIWLCSVNVGLLVGEVLVYGFEEIWLRKGEWRMWELVMLVLSVPGAFMLFVPVWKQSMGTVGMRVFLRLLWGLSMVRLLRLPMLLVNRNSVYLSSQLLRTWGKNLPLSRMLYALLIHLIVCIMLWAFVQTANMLIIPEYVASYGSFLQFMMGTHAANPTKDHFPYVLMLWLGGLWHMFIKAYLLSLVLYPYVEQCKRSWQNGGNKLMSLRMEQDYDMVVECLVQYGLQKQCSLCCLEYNNFYHLTSRLIRAIYPTYMTISKYNITEKLFYQLQIPIYTEKSGKYVMFIHDIIHAMYEWKYAGSVVREPVAGKMEGYKKTQMNSQQLSYVLMAKLPVMRALKRARRTISGRKKKGK